MLWSLKIICVHLWRKYDKERRIMARPIRETPILYGDAARRFVKRMNEKRTDDPEKKRIRLENYQTVLAML